VVPARAGGVAAAAAAPCSPGHQPACCLRACGQWCVAPCITHLSERCDELLSGPGVGGGEDGGDRVAVPQELHLRRGQERVEGRGGLDHA
jgi:hypothetical protein